MDAASRSCHRRSRFVPTSSSRGRIFFLLFKAGYLRCSTVPVDLKDAQMLNEGAGPWWKVIAWLRRQHSARQRPCTLATQSAYFTSAFGPTAHAESTVPSMWQGGTSDIPPQYREPVASPYHIRTPVSKSAGHSKPLPSPPHPRGSWVETPRTHELLNGVRDDGKRVEHEEVAGEVMQRTPRSPKSAPAHLVRGAS